MKTATLRNNLSGRARSACLRVAKPDIKALRIRNVLVPIDFSQSSLEAIEFALPLVKQFGANLHLMHVFEPDYPLASTAAFPLVVPLLQVGQRVRRHLKDVAKKYSIALRPENVHARRGRPFEEICRLARDRDIDLIVTSTRGNTGLKHLALGSTAERVVRHSPCPVLVVRGNDRKNKEGANGKSQRATGFKRILVPIDFSACSMKGLAYAKKLAKEFDASLVLFHSVHFQYYITSDEYARYDLPLLMQQAEEIARKRMRDLVGKTNWKGIKVESSLQIGHAGYQVCGHARNYSADLIVTSTHGITGLKHILLGSTAEYVVRHAPCAVLVVPNHERPGFASGPKK
jgi:nucleotide-binding universal stress UspA family protein